ncbi:FmdB family zinc ribbon protein [Rhodococcus oryzae]|uniref:FmdB family zinc ribbon protein n=1 Tax=Rhodococcus oryzae TaxID=2571143 RepID=UPI003718B59C
MKLMEVAVPYYQFTCRSCGSFDSNYTMADVPLESACPRCANPSARSLGGAGLIRTQSAAARLIDQTKRTASEPAVVGAPPPSTGNRAFTRNPVHRKLPRP